MRSRNASKFTTIRVLKENHRKLIEYSHKDESFDVVLSRLFHDVENVNFDLLTVDDDPAIKHRAAYIIGNAKYQYNHGKYTLIGVP